MLKQDPQHPISEHLRVSHLLQNCWELPQDVRAQCDRYFLRVWKGAYLPLSLIQDGTLMVYQGRYHKIHWQVPPELAMASDSVLLSFRGRGDHDNHVLIRIRGRL